MITYLKEVQNFYYFSLYILKNKTFMTSVPSVNAHLFNIKEIIHETQINNKTTPSNNK